ncbi:MAG: hypothetical protein QXX46_01805 [Candidatus Anstonellales archaeon]
MKLKTAWRNIKNTGLILVSLLPALSCAFAHREVQPTESPKSAPTQNTTQNTSDSMISAQKTKEVAKDTIPVKTDTTKVFDEKSEEKIESYINELINTGRITLPKEDGWMAKVIQDRLNPKDGYYYMISIHRDSKSGDIDIYLIVRMKF